MTIDDVYELLSPLGTKERLETLDRVMMAHRAKLDPDTAEVVTTWGHTMDPYGVADLSPELEQIGRLVFVRNPGGLWVWLAHVPQAVRDALDARFSSDNPDFEVAFTP